MSFVQGRRRVTCACFFGALLLLSITAVAGAGPSARPAAGSLDKSFGGDGRVTTSVPGDGLGAAAFAFQPGTGYLGLSRLFNREGPDSAILVRYGLDGSLDTSFGEGGRLIRRLGEDEAPEALAVRPDASFVTAGSDRTNLIIRSYTRDGGIDEAFGDNGAAVIPFPDGRPSAADVVVQPDGALVVSASQIEPADPSYFFSKDEPKIRLVLARVRADGSPDEGFGEGGRVTTPFEDGQAFPAGHILQPSGKIVVAVTFETVRIARVRLLRFNADGSLDTLVRTGGGELRGRQVAAIARRPGGRFVIAGNGGGVFVAQFRANGLLDRRFGRRGVAEAQVFKSSDALFVNDLAIQPDGKIVLGGVNAVVPRTFALTRFTAGGALDRSFGSRGGVLTRFRTKGRLRPSEISALLVGPRDQIVAAGDLSFAFALARYHP